QPWRWDRLDARGAALQHQTGHMTHHEEPNAPANSDGPIDAIASTATKPALHDDIIYPSALAFIVLHLACLAIVWTGVSWQSVSLCVALYWLRIFAIGAGYHRYFSHRSFATSRIFQFVLAFCAQTT